MRKLSGARLEEYYTSAINDPLLQEIMEGFDRCSVGRDNGTWGCAGCPRSGKCGRLTNLILNKSIKHHLRPEEKAYFDWRWSILQKGLKKECC